MMGLLQQAMAADDQWKATEHIPMGPPTGIPRSRTDHDHRSHRECDLSFSHGSHYQSRSGRRCGSDSPSDTHRRRVSTLPPPSRRQESKACDSCDTKKYTKSQGKREEKTHYPGRMSPPNQTMTPPRGAAPATQSKPPDS